MDILIGIGLLLYGVGAAVYSVLNGFQLNLFYQIAASTVGSFFILFPNLKTLYSKVIGFIKNKSETKNETKHSLKTSLDCEEQGYDDFVVMHYLKHRATQLNSKEFLDAIKEINAILFASSCQPEEKKENV